MIRTDLRGWPTLFSTAVLALIIGVETFHLSQNESGWYAVILMDLSLCFLAIGAALRINHTGSLDKPPTILIGIALGAETTKACLLYVLPAPASQSIASSTAALLAHLALAAAVGLGLASFTLAAFVASGFTVAHAERWESKESKHNQIAKLLRNAAEVSRWFRENRVSALLSTFASFLLLTQLLAIATAFADANPFRRALYHAAPSQDRRVTSQKAAADLNSPFRLPNEGTLSLAFGSVAGAPLPATVSSEVFYFTEGTAALDAPLRLLLENTAICNAGSAAHPEAAYGREVRNLHVSKEAEILTAHNVSALCAAREHLRSCAATRTPQRIVIVGHTNAHRNEGSIEYHSNSELANGRAQQVLLALNRIATDIEKDDRTSVCQLISWQVASGSSETLFVDPDTEDSSQSPSLDGHRTVEVQHEWVERSTRPESPSLTVTVTRHPDENKLEILDYLYFMIYTTSTTGYGDLMPLTATAKFIVSVGNLFEFMYIAITFALVAVRT